LNHKTGINVIFRQCSLKTAYSYERITEKRAWQNKAIMMAIKTELLNKT